MTTVISSALADRVREDFPILHQTVNSQPLIYLDNAATSQKPTAVLAAMDNYYRWDNANVHRGIHTLSSRATTAYEAARDKVAQFVNARDRVEIAFTRNATESINLVAYSWGLENLTPGDEIIISVMEHHSNIVPWQMVAQKTGAVLRHIPLTPEETLDLQQFQSLLSQRTKLVAIVHVSNTLGVINPVEEIISLAHGVGAKVLVDACQSAPHLPLDVQTMDCDWLVASGHKMCAPTGIGFVYGKQELLETTQPFLGGGEMIEEVFLDHSTYNGLPHRFEAGTPAIAEAVALGAAVDYLQNLGMEQIHQYEQELTNYLWDKISQIEGLRIYGPQSSDRGSLVAFNVDNIHANDLATLLDQEGIAIRSGHHCTQPLHRLFDASGSARASCYFYNTFSEIDHFVKALQETIAFFDIPDDFE